MTTLRKRRYGLGAPSINILAKPAKYTPSAATVAPKFQSHWTNLDSLFPIWDASGAPVDVLNGSRTINVTGPPPVPYGTASDGKVLDWTGVATLCPTTVANSNVPASRSILVTFTPITASSSDLFHGLWGIVDGGFYLCDVGYDDRGLLLFYEVNGGGAQQLFSPTGTVTLGKRHCAVCVTDNSGGTPGMRMFFNGALIASNTLSGWATGTGKLMMANLNPSPFVGNQCDWKMSMCGYWTRALTNTEAIDASADPYGLVRPK